MILMFDLLILPRLGLASAIHFSEPEAQEEFMECIHVRRRLECIHVWVFVVPKNANWLYEYLADVKLSKSAFWYLLGQLGHVLCISP